MEGSGRGVIRYYLDICQRDWEKSRKASIGIAGLRAEIWTWTSRIRSRSANHSTTTCGCCGCGCGGGGGGGGICICVSTTFNHTSMHLGFMQSCQYLAKLRPETKLVLRLLFGVGYQYKMSSKSVVYFQKTCDRTERHMKEHNLLCMHSLLAKTVRAVHATGIIFIPCLKETVSSSSSSSSGIRPSVLFRLREMHHSIWF
jgi:hypothetical protein